MKKELLPECHIVDQGYMSIRLIQQSQDEYQTDLLGPVSTGSGWQAQAGQGFDLSHFKIDWKRQVAKCPQGKFSRDWKVGQDNYGNPIIHVGFRERDCAKCPVRSQCTRAKTAPRELTVKLPEAYQVLQAARARQETDEFKQRYALRAGVEGTISQAVRGFEIRQCRYAGLAKTRLQHILTAAAINVVRAVNWLEGVPLAKARQSRFAKLAPVRAV